MVDNRYKQEDNTYRNCSQAQPTYHPRVPGRVAHRCGDRGPAPQGIPSSDRESVDPTVRGMAHYHHDAEQQRRDDKQAARADEAIIREGKDHDRPDQVKLLLHRQRPEVVKSWDRTEPVRQISPVPYLDAPRLLCPIPQIHKSWKR
jgi:hypothetical protein